MRATGATGMSTAERIVELSYVELHTGEDTVEGHLIRRYWKGHYFRDLSDGAIEALLLHDPEVGASLQAYGGAIAEVADEDTAFSQRDVAFDTSRLPDGPTRPTTRTASQCARESAARLEPFASGMYVNVISDEGLAGVSRAYSPEKLARLAAVKADVRPRQRLPPQSQHRTCCSGATPPAWTVVRG